METVTLCNVFHVQRMSYPVGKKNLGNFLCQCSPASGAGELLPGAVISLSSCAGNELSAGLHLTEEAATQPLCGTGKTCVKGQGWGDERGQEQQGSNSPGTLLGAFVYVLVMPPAFWTNSSPIFPCVRQVKYVTSVRVYTLAFMEKF